MKKCIRLMILLCVPFLAAACQTTPNLTNPCDVLVRTDPKPETNAYLVENDRGLAVSIARNRGRFQAYGCK